VGRADYYAPGDWNAVCSMCGRKRKASQLVKNWQGMWRCREHNEARHPQDFVRSIPDDQSVPWSQPPTDIDVQFCTLEGISAVPGWMLPGCSVPSGRGPLAPPIDFVPPIIIPPEPGLDEDESWFGNYMDEWFGGV
jgi:hypothetical protein